MELAKYLSAIALTISTGTTSAAALTFSFSGYLNRISDNYNLLNGQFAVGNTFTGTVTYMTGVPESSSTLPDPTVAIYSAITDFKYTINGYSYDDNAARNGYPIGPGYLQVWDDRIITTNPVDSVSFSSQIDYTPAIYIGEGTILSSASLMLFDNSHKASKTGTNIPTSINLNDFDGRIFSALQMISGTNTAFHLNGVVTQISPVAIVSSPIPAPPAYILILTSLSILGLTSRLSKAQERV